MNWIYQIIQRKLILKETFGYLKTKVDNLDVDELSTVPVDLSKLTNVLDNDVVKKLSMIN